MIADKKDPLGRSAAPDAELLSKSHLLEPQALACICTGGTPVPPFDCRLVHLGPSLMGFF
jgi:hypothetical protein